MANVPTTADIGRGYAEWLDQKEKAQKEAKDAKTLRIKQSRLENERKRAREEDMEPVPILEEFELISSAAEGKVSTKEDIAKSILSPNCTNVCYFICCKGGRCKKTANLRVSQYVIIVVNGVRIKVKHCTLHWGEVRYNNNGERDEQQDHMDELVEIGLDLARAIAPELASWLERSLAEEIAGVGSASTGAGLRVRTREPIERTNTPHSEDIVSQMNGVVIGSANNRFDAVQAPTNSAATQAPTGSAIPTPPPDGKAKRYTRASATASKETPDRGAALAHNAPQTDSMDVS